LVARGHCSAFGHAIIVERLEDRMYYLVDAPATVHQHQLRVEIQKKISGDDDDEEKEKKQGKGKDKEKDAKQ